ncbi:hypothetical protein KM043_003504 [Ampulex compressa]|nr:hypothetical protein KM043_003504 [Ampulex compressa]
MIGDNSDIAAGARRLRFKGRPSSRSLGSFSRFLEDPGDNVARSRGLMSCPDSFSRPGRPSRMIVATTAAKICRGIADVPGNCGQSGDRKVEGTFYPGTPGGYGGFGG